MEPLKQSKFDVSLTDPAFDKAIDSWYSGSSESRVENQYKQSLINLTPNLLLPSTPAREISEFFDKINNLDPVKYSPPIPKPRARQTAMQEK